GGLLVLVAGRIVLRGLLLLGGCLARLGVLGKGSASKHQRRDDTRRKHGFAVSHGCLPSGMAERARLHGRRAPPLLSLAIVKAPPWCRRWVSMLCRSDRHGPDTSRRHGRHQDGR